MKSLNFEKLIGICSLFIAACAAFFSIIGIGMLFSGSAIAAMIMASSLEFGKLVATTFLYRYWHTTKVFLKVYLSISVILLMFITSLGIFGYLTSAYQSSNIKNQITEQKIQLLIEQKNTTKENIIDIKNRIENIIQLRNTQESRLNESITNVLISRNPIQMRQIQEQTQELIDKSEKNIEQENNKVQTYLQTLENLDKEITTLKLESSDKKDIQTFKFVADEFNLTLNQVVKWFIIILITVFDPLAICLLLAYNTAIFKKDIKTSIELNPLSIETPVNVESSSSIETPVNVESISPSPSNTQSKLYPFSF